MKQQPRCVGARNVQGYATNKVENWKQFDV